MLALLLVASPLPASDLRVDAWHLSTAPANSALRRVSPEVHYVRVEGGVAIVESAGLSMTSFGVLDAKPADRANGIRRFEYRIPLTPHPAARLTSVPWDVIGVFLNGVPIYHPGAALSYRDQNLWHADAVAQADDGTAAVGGRPAPQRQSNGQPRNQLLQALLDRKSEHSPLLGFALDGYPVYGPYGWDPDRRVRPFRSSYQLRRQTKRSRWPDGTLLTPAQEGPDVSPQFPAGTFIEDYEYVAGSGDLDQHNGRFAATPEFPQGTYAYFLATQNGRLAYPYLIGPTYLGVPSEPATAPYHRLGQHQGLTLSTSHPALTAGEETILRIESPHPLLERVHEREIHLLVISEDMADFHHIHPLRQPNGTYQVAHRFTRPGRYGIFADHTPPGQPQTIAKFQVSVAGKEASQSRELVSATAATAAGITAHLCWSEPPQAGRDLQVAFSLTDANGAPITDLDPYLGAWAHILLVRRDGEEFIHAHPIEESTTAVSDPWQHSHATLGPSPSRIATLTGFRHPGHYRLWLQVQRAGQVVTLPFDVEVAAAVTAPEPAPASTAANLILVSQSGYQPARLQLPANQPSRVSFRRVDAQNCGGRVVFPDLGISWDLPPNQTITIDLPAQPTRELSFTCGMGMYRGSVIVK
ncbi:MAG: YHYH protein [Acidobacteria bacterium]|nr:YHYH protein [Acidobacteriota bacterium]